MNSASASVSAQATTDEQTTAGRDLVNYVVTEYQHTCYLVSPDDPAIANGAQAADVASIQATIGCVPSSGAIHTDYTQYSNHDAMMRAYTAYLGGPLPETGDLSSCPGDNVWQYKGEDAGRVACYTTTTGSTDGQPYVAMVWTADKQNILGTAYRNDDDAAALTSWWKTEAGPTYGHLDGIPDPNTSLSVGAANHKLLQHVPKTFRNTCKVQNVDDKATVGDDVFKNRIWYVAQLACYPKGYDLVLFTLTDFQAMPDLFQATFTDHIDKTGKPVVVDGVSCPGQKSYTLGKSKQAVGDYACFNRTDVSENGSVYKNAAVMAWTSKKLGIIAEAVRGDGNVQKLVKFWEDAGPN